MVTFLAYCVLVAQAATDETGTAEGIPPVSGCLKFMLSSVACHLHVTSMKEIDLFELRWCEDWLCFSIEVGLGFAVKGTR